MGGGVEVSKNVTTSNQFESERYCFCVSDVENYAKRVDEKQKDGS